MYEIGVFLEERDVISSFEEAKYVKIFKKDNNVWKAKKSIIINRNNGAKGISQIREEYKKLVDQMDECKIVVVNKAFGIPYSVFYLQDFSIWELEGEPLKYLDEIVKSEIEQETMEVQEEEIGQKIKEGHYFIDLLELEITNPEMSSKNAIIPYMKQEDVKKIDIHCCHVPLWLIKERDKGNIKMEVEEVKGNDFNVSIVINN
ncbi:iron only nitrogenase protein AnfO [Clostridium puniceum]|uniref:Iron only nitrogenase protein AnfO n=1 Tax=Clostridium puniceum TaxID=29367 RepID=A0A1S8T6S8_9CLOT|nr:Fe-only nitrogenase accessory AnfO family protein [Clostridium puniceum]OOM73500.1 iron only nitrogenase protein AnfO [Clostridium puniceum]